MCGTINATRWPRLSEARCSTPCNGDKTEKCGGAPAPGGTGDAVSVYNVSCTGGTPSPQLVVSSSEPASSELKIMNVSGRLVGEGWNMLRILAEPSRCRVWLNPNFADVTGGSGPPADQGRAPHAPAPLVDVTAARDESRAGLLRASTVGGAWAIDYASVLPPSLL